LAAIQAKARADDGAADAAAGAADRRLAAQSETDDLAGRQLLAAAQDSITAYHDGHRDAGNLLRVVYFYPKDRDPLPGYAERLDRVMTDVSDFYRDGLARLGIQTKGLPLERKDGRLVLHLVQGKKPASRYSYDDGGTPTREIRAALKGVVDMEREHVLVIHGLCRKEPDGRYVFHAPYYGAAWSGRQAGLCHAADCELLDPLLLTETNRRIVYAEHYYPRVEQTVARFNSWYLGGIAHELGHGLGLPHDAGEPAERHAGTSLMGGGNHAYRQEVWGGGKPAFLSRASALRLAAHPLFTESNRGRWDDARGKFEGVEFSNAEDDALQISGRARGDIEPYAAVAYVYPFGSKTDHGAKTYPAAVKDGAFALRITGLRPGKHRLSLVMLHVNGAATKRRLSFHVDANGRTDVDALNATWRIQQTDAKVPRRRLNGPSGTKGWRASGIREQERGAEVLIAIRPPRHPLHK
jgi:hypothetical protein